MRTRSWPYLSALVPEALPAGDALRADGPLATAFPGSSWIGRGE